MSFITKNLPFLVLSMLLTLMYLSFYVFEARTEINIQTNSPINTYFKMYWADKGQAYNESRMAQVQVNNQQQQYHLKIADLDDIERIRIDPVEYPAKVLIRKIHLSQFGYKPIMLSGKQGLGALTIIQQAQAAAYKKTDGVVFQTTGNDGQLEIKLNPVQQATFPTKHLVTWLSILALLALFIRYLTPILTDLRFVPYLLAIAFLLTLMMALSSQTNIHPDEAVHLSAVNYYSNHLLPPPLDSELAAPTYSVYGHSRLSNYEIYYQLAGYFQKAVNLLGDSNVFGARLFSLCLFALMLLFSVVNKHFRPFTLPILISAQTWYLFSYANSDAFALTITICLSYLVAYHRSMLNLFLTEVKPKNYLLKLIGLGLLFGALLLSKANYYFFVLFLGLYLFWRILQGHFPAQKRLWTRIGLLVIIATSMYGARFAMDVSANGWDQASMAAQMQEKYAQPSYKPSSELSQKNSMLHLRQRGKSLGEIVVTDRWFEKTFKSTFGVYGFSKYFASLTYYDFVRYTSLSLLLILLVGVLKGDIRAHLSLLAIIGVCASGLILSSIWHSWNVIFQPQGRYMMPILPMLAVYYYHVRESTIPHVIEWLSITLFGLAAYSFIYVGLANIDRLHQLFG